MPGGQRVEACTASLRAAGHRVQVADAQLLLTRRAFPVSAPGSFVRVESPSDDPGLDADLIALGGGGRVDVAGGALPDSVAWVRGLDTLLVRLREELAGSDAVPLFDVAAILTMFDKATTHRLLAGELPVAPVVLPAEPTLAAIREAAGWASGAVFVKARYGSSGAGICALRWSGQRWAGYTTVALNPARNVPVRRVEDPDELAAVVAAIAQRGGLHVERWLPKFGFDGGAVDLRVVVIGGRARHVLARVGAGPLTNLHLGARRGDVTALRAALGARWEHVLQVAEEAAGCVQAAHHLGVDVGLTRAGEPFVIELNAFGDFHEGVLDDDGLDTYQAEIAVALQEAR